MSKWRTQKPLFANFEIFSGKHLCWSLFFSYQKETPTNVLSCEYCKIIENNFFYRPPPVAASEGLHHGFFTGKFPDSGKLYQRLELEYLNQRRWWDVYVCFMVLLNVQYIMFEQVQQKFLQAPRFNINRFCWTELLKMLLSLALLMNGISLILTSEVIGRKVYFVMLHWILLGLL